ncbi:MAG TPA: PIG-L family deacetylase [Cyclobacteriaceae bacterium]|nr:PIG-L family deacetylase [Cyclobacteriaceae bacterium]
MIFGKNRRIAAAILLFVLYSFPGLLLAQSSSEIYHELLKLKETRRVLYIAAHPDDENTRLIAYLSNKEHVQVAYLSLTRGDGGQNLIGKELGLELGMIRTQELLRARETDGGRQFFTRAIDFGFSKNPDETLNNWDKEKLLSDVVWIIRNFQPDIIINRFNTIPGTTHGHHTTSALLSIEAFRAAADPKAFPEQLKHVQPWKTQRVFWNGYNWETPYKPAEGKISYAFPVGAYNPLLGTTYSQIAADSRTMHKSQGFGATAQIGKAEDHIELIDGEKFKENPFEGVPNRWATVENGTKIESAIAELIGDFDFLHPENNISQLVEVRKMLDKLDDKPWVVEKREQVNKIILDALGLKAAYLSAKELSFPGETTNTTLIVNNPSAVSLQVKTFTYLGENVAVDKTLKDNETLHSDLRLTLPIDYPISQPYWIEAAPKDNLFTIDDQLSIGKPFNAPTVEGRLVLKVDGLEIVKKLPLTYKYNDPVDGEINQPFTVVPEIKLAVDKDNVFVVNGQPGTVEVRVAFENGIVEGALLLEGLSANDYKETEKRVDETKNTITYKVELKGLPSEEKRVIGVKYRTTDGRVYEQGFKRINYKHIPNLTYFPKSTFNLINLSLEMTAQKIGYIPGAGDDVPVILANLGYDVAMLDNGLLNAVRLGQFNTIIVGIRAFNTNVNLANHVDDLMDYVASGGNLIVQYNTSGPLLAKQLGPYPFHISRDRVAVEGSSVKMDVSHPVFRSPNPISLKDFDDWVQERGLYFPNQWDEQFTAPLTMQDPGESETKGALLLAKYGKGTYTYSGISWFRQLPAGVPGAIKLFVNLIEQNHE